MHRALRARCRRRSASGRHGGAVVSLLNPLLRLSAARQLITISPLASMSLTAEEQALAAELPASQWQGLEAWYMDSSDADQRLPHRCSGRCGGRSRAV